MLKMTKNQSKSKKQKKIKDKKLLLFDVKDIFLKFQPCCREYRKK